MDFCVRLLAPTPRLIWGISTEHRSLFTVITNMFAVNKSVFSMYKKMKINHVYISLILQQMKRKYLLCHVFLFSLKAGTGVRAGRYI